MAILECQGPCGLVLKAPPRRGALSGLFCTCGGAFRVRRPDTLPFLWIDRDDWDALGSVPPWLVWLFIRAGRLYRKMYGAVGPDSHEMLELTGCRLHPSVIMKMGATCPLCEPESRKDPA